MPVKNAKGARGACDRYWQRIVKRNGVCERCGISGVTLQAAHIIKRRFAKTRTDERNGLALCGRCHYLVDSFTDEMMKMVDATIGRTVYYELKETSLDIRRKMDWESEKERLRERCRELGC